MVIHKSDWQTGKQPKHPKSSKSRKSRYVPQFRSNTTTS